MLLHCVEDLMDKFKFVKQSTDVSKEEEYNQLRAKMWQILEGEKRNGIRSETLKVFFAAIMKILLYPETGVTDVSSANNRYGTYSEDGVFNINQAQATRVHKDFILPYLNRITYNSPGSSKPTEESGYTFKPSLCEHSVTLVHSVRDKHAGKEQNSESVVSRPKGYNEHVEMLNQAKKDQEEYSLLIYLYRKLKKKKEEIEKAEKAVCTFKPQITEYKHGETEESKLAAKHVKVSTSKPTADRCQSLYELSKKIVKKDDKPTDEYVFEKEKDQYTFAPNIEKEKVFESEDTKAPQIAETIERMKRGREERMRVKVGTERIIDESGMRFDIEISKFKKENTEGGKQISVSHASVVSKSSAKKDPHNKQEGNSQSEGVMSPEQSANAGETSTEQEKLYIDVNFGQKVERIIVRKGDTATGLAAQFAEEHRKRKLCNEY